MSVPDASPDAGNDVGPLTDVGPTPDAGHRCMILGPSAPLPDATLETSAQRLAANAVGPSLSFDVCDEPTCAAPSREQTTSSGEIVIAPPLDEGLYYWRVRDGVTTTPVWRFRVSGTITRGGRRPVDIDGDGTADIVGCDGTEHAVWAGAVGRAPDGAAWASANCFVPAHAPDFDGDGRSDIVTIEYGWVGLQRGDACGASVSLARVGGLEAPASWVSASASDLGDLDRDGSPRRPCSGRGARLPGLSRVSGGRADAASRIGP